jgi:RHS repeat-associated protein
VAYWHQGTVRWGFSHTGTYTYHALNRVSTASSQATSGSDCWGQSFSYDRYANLTTISVTRCTAPMLSLSLNTNNQITNAGFTYDADGDLTGDGTYTYSWNAEQHLKSAASVTYTYDGDLRRVEKSSGTLYWYCAVCGQVMAESDLSGNIISEYALFNKQRIARRDISSGNVYYIFSDRLGSYRTLTDSSGNVESESDYYPFGAERVISSTVTDNFRFAGMEWESEDGLNHTLYRQYTPAQGRWESPDPERGCVNFPQGQNLYSYVRDNATDKTDPSGNLMVDGAGCDPRCSNLCFYMYNPDICPPECPPSSPFGCGGADGGDGDSGSGTCQASWSRGSIAATSGYPLEQLCTNHKPKWWPEYSYLCWGDDDCCVGKLDAFNKWCSGLGKKNHEPLNQPKTQAGFYGECCKTDGPVRPPAPWPPPGPGPNPPPT